MTRSLRLVHALALFMLLGSTGRATDAGPVFWTIASQADFLKGTSTGVSIDTAGRLVAAPAVTTVHDLAAPQAWSLARGADGSWYAGTGGDGRVVRGRGTEVSTILDVEPSAIHAIAVSGARVYAASSPEGRVHVVDADGSSREFFDPPEPYIWALETDRQGRLWVATGHPASIYRVNPDGTSVLVYRPTARHVVSLAVDQSGRVFAGTEQPARLYRIDDGDRPFVVLESALDELRTIRPTPDGGLFLAALTATGEPGNDNVTGSITITVGGAQAGTSTTTAAGAATGRRSVIYRVNAAGVWDPVWETTDAIYDLAVVDDETVLAASGPEGRVYQLGRDGAAWLLTSVDGRQVTRMLRDGPRTLMLSANPGRVLALPAASSSTSSGTYTSPVRDAKTLAQWGTIQWDGSGGIQLQTRSGNTELPDDSWTPWSAAYTQATGQPVQSPGARFLQWRATFPSAGAAAGNVLTSVTVAYLPRNSRPTVTEVTLHPAGVVFQRPFSSDDGAIAGLDDAVAEARRPPGGDPAAGSASLGRRMFQRGLRTLQWKAEDADGDRLSFALEYRREGEVEWHPLRDALPAPLFVWDTTAVADGRYIVRVTASDQLSNTTDRVLTGSRLSDPVDVDNTPPVITLTVTGLRVDVRVTDGHSGVHRVDAAIGGGAWQELRPTDGLADSRDERYTLTLPSADAAARLVVRAADVMQNTTSAVVR